MLCDASAYFDLDGLSHGFCFWSTKELSSCSFSRSGAYSLGRSGCSFDSLGLLFTKNQSDTSGSIEVVLLLLLLLLLSDFSSVVGDKLWCPVRALIWYLLKTTSFHKSDQLFLISRETFSATSRDTISRWLVSVIRTAGPEALTPGRSPRAHDTRSVSSSWALFNEVFFLKIFARQLFGSLLVPLLLCISKMYPLARMLSRSLL